MSNSICKMSDTSSGLLQLDALAKGYHPMLMGSKFTVDAPTAIGGLGGSGTRVFAALLQEGRHLHRRLPQRAAG